MAQLETFHLIAIGVAAVVLIVALVFIGIMIVNGKKVKSFPPLANVCPDFWLQDNSGNCVIPTDGRKNSIKGGSSTLKSVSTPGLITERGINLAIDFSNEGWSKYGSTKTANCGKRKWTKEHGVFWDGITNFNDCETNS
jgi:hypothetical protein